MTEPTLRDCTEEATWWPQIDEAVRALARGALAVIPTDTVYGLAADAFTPAAVTKLLDAKGRGRQMPPPVLIGDLRTLDGLAVDVSDHVRNLVEKFWPGPLTVIVNAQPTLMWDLGDTRGTVALRMPDDPCALALLRRTGPLAVSSANLSGSPAALTAADAAEQLGDAADIYLDAGPARGAVASTIIDATGPELQIVRHGALGVTELAAVAPIYAPEPQAEEPAAGAGADDEGEQDSDGTGTAAAGAEGAGHDEDAADRGEVPQVEDAESGGNTVDLSESPEVEPDADVTGEPGVDLIGQPAPAGESGKAEEPGEPEEPEEPAGSSQVMQDVAGSAEDGESPAP